MAPRDCRESDFNSFNVRKYFLMIRAFQKWNKFPQELLSYPVTERFKYSLDNHFSRILRNEFNYQVAFILPTLRFYDYLKKGL